MDSDRRSASGSFRVKAGLQCIMGNDRALNSALYSNEGANRGVSVVGFYAFQ